MTGCTVPDCCEPSRARGLCEMHYRRLLRTGTTDPRSYRGPLDTGWMEDAACKDCAPSVFFPERGEPTEPAKQVCNGCPVRFECLEYALATAEKIGIWGGRSERERRAIRRQRRQGREVA